MEQQYGVRPKALLGGAKDVKEINDWVSQETGGKVPRFLSKPLPRNAGVNTVSAAHFKGRWLNFDPSADVGAEGQRVGVLWVTGKWVTRFSRSGELGTFQLDGGTPVRIPMMQQDNYPVKMGADSDLSCTVSILLVRVSFGFECVGRF